MGDVGDAYAASFGSLGRRGDARIDVQMPLGSFPMQIMQVARSASDVRHWMSLFMGECLFTRSTVPWEVPFARLPVSRCRLRRKQAGEPIAKTRRRACSTIVRDYLRLFSCGTYDAAEQL